ncbi:MAG: hypothetical protein HY291_21915 [Planctomycetes bacterium]|nr:hypothetical protein [Planctomycetota bacterium]
MSICVRCGVNSTNLDSLAGKTIREVRDEVGDLLGVAANAQPRINGAPVSEDARVPEGASVEFVKVAGEKGAA